MTRRLLTVAAWLLAYAIVALAVAIVLLVGGCSWPQHKPAAAVPGVSVPPCDAPVAPDPYGLTPADCRAYANASGQDWYWPEVYRYCLGAPSPGPGSDSAPCLVLNAAAKPRKTGAELLLWLVSRQTYSAVEKWDGGW